APCETSSSSASTSDDHHLVRLLLRRIAALVELRRVLDLLLRRRRVRCIRDGLRRRLDLRLDHRLLAAFGRHGAVVRPGLLDVLVRRCVPRAARTAAAARRTLTAAAPACRTSAATLAAAALTAAAGRALARRRSAPARALAGASAAAACSAAAAGTPAALAHGPEALAVLAAAAAARGAETLGRAAAAAPCVLVAQPRVLAGEGVAEAGGHDLALVDPDLDADPPGGRARLDEAVVDVGADRVQRHAAFVVGLAPAHLAAAETARALDLHAGRTGANRARERALHRAAERDAVRELLGDRLRDELRVELGTLDLVDVDVDVLLRDRVQLLTERVDLDAGLADDDPRTRGVDVDRDPLLVLPDQDVRQPGVRELLVDVLADADVLEDVRGDFLLPRVPVRLPVVDDADAQATR